MASSRIVPDAPSTYYSIPVDFTFKGITVGDIGTMLPISWQGGLGLFNWPLNFATVTGSGTAGAFAIRCLDLAYLPDQNCGFVTTGTAMTPLFLAAGQMTSSLTLTAGARITVSGMIGPLDIVNL